MTAPGAAAEAAGYRLGLSYMFVATLFTSIAGLVLRLVEAADGWQIMFYRATAAVVTFLCLPQAGYITGQALAVDGGLCM